MFNPEKAIKKILGPGVNVPRFGKSSSDDLDGDGISNLKDCQPKNMFRQDVNGWRKLSRDREDPAYKSGKVSWNNFGALSGAIYLKNNKVVVIIGGHTLNKPDDEWIVYKATLKPCSGILEKEFETIDYSKYPYGGIPHNFVDIKGFNNMIPATQYAEKLRNKHN